MISFLKTVKHTSILALISLLLLIGCSKPEKIITSDTKAIIFVQNELRDFCSRDQINCPEFVNPIIITNELDQQPDSKYKWFIEFRSKENPNKVVTFVVSEWGEREISNSLNMDLN